MENSPNPSSDKQAAERNAVPRAASSPAGTIQPFTPFSTRSKGRTHAVGGDHGQAGRKTLGNHQPPAVVTRRGTKHIRARVYRRKLRPVTEAEKFESAFRERQAEAGGCAPADRRPISFKQTVGCQAAKALNADASKSTPFRRVRDPEKNIVRGCALNGRSTRPNRRRSEK